MAYLGYLIRVGDYVIPRRIIKAESYKVTYNSQDIDSYRDANGNLHREALNNFVPKVEFNTVPLMNNTELSLFLANIRFAYINEVERKVTASVYIPEIDDYVTQNMYFADFTPEIFYADDNIIKYNSIRFAFIGYGNESEMIDND